METISVIIVDDHELFRSALRMAIENRHNDIVITGEAGSGAEFFDLLETVAADMTLLDIAMPGMNGIEIARRLKNERPEMKILAVSAENSAAKVEEMLQTGVEGFIGKSNCKPDTVAEAIRSIMQGYDYFGKDISGIISRIYVAKKKTKQISDEFTGQEKRIIEYCHQGLSAKLIADRMGVTSRAVEWHKANMFRKLGINSTLELMRYIVENKIVRME